MKKELSGIQGKRCQIAQGLCGRPATANLSYAKGGRVYEVRRCCGDAECLDLATKNATSLGVTVTSKEIAA